MATAVLSTMRAHSLWKAAQFSTRCHHFSPGYRQRFHRSFTFLNHPVVCLTSCQGGLHSCRSRSPWGKKVLKTLPHAISTRGHVRFSVNSPRLTALSTVVHKSYP